MRNIILKEKNILSFLMKITLSSHGVVRTVLFMTKSHCGTINSRISCRRGYRDFIVSMVCDREAQRNENIAFLLQGTVVSWGDGNLQNSKTEFVFWKNHVLTCVIQIQVQLQGNRNIGSREESSPYTGTILLLGRIKRAHGIVGQAVRQIRLNVNSI